MAEIYYLWGTYNHNDEGTYYETIGFYSTEALALEARANFVAEEWPDGVGEWARLEIREYEIDTEYLEATSNGQ